MWHRRNKSKITSSHINAALNIGVKSSEIIDIMTHISGYAGFPAALNGVATAREVFTERDEKQLVD
jgi:4-carboxymuconolactone decarboxylase